MLLITNTLNQINSQTSHICYILLKMLFESIFKFSNFDVTDNKKVWIHYFLILDTSFDTMDIF